MSAAALIEVASDESFGSLGARQSPADKSTDYYYHRDEKVHLIRSPREIVVRLPSASEAERQRVLALLGQGAAAGARIVNNGRTFELVVLPPGADVSSAVIRLLMDGQVVFAASTYYRADTQTRLVPTDDIIIKLKPGTARTDVDDLLATYGVAIVHGMVGTVDEYIVRILRPSTDDPLGTSRSLYETGRFEWVEPDFLQEIQH